MASVTGSNKYEMGVETGLPELEKPAVYIENSIYNGKSPRVGQNKNGFEFQLDLYDPNFGADLINFFHGAKRSGEEGRLEVLRDVMRSLEGDELKLFEDSLAVVVRSYHATFGNYTREVSKRIEDFQKNRSTSPYEKAMPIPIESFDQLKYVCEQLSRIKDKKLREKIDVSFDGFVFGKDPSVDPEENAGNVQKIMKMIDTIERYGSRELREKLQKSIFLMEDRRTDVLDLPNEYTGRQEKLKEFSSRQKLNKWEKSGLESMSSSMSVDEIVRDGEERYHLHELFENEGVIFSPNGEIYLTDTSLHPKYVKEIRDTLSVVPVAVAMSKGVMHDRAVTLEAIRRMKDVMNRFEFGDYTPLSSVFEPEVKVDRQTDSFYNQLIKLEKAIAEKKMHEIPYDPTADGRHRERVERRVVDAIEREIEQKISGYQLESKKSFLRTKHSLSEEDAKDFIQFYQTVGAWARQQGLSDYHTFNRAIHNLTTRSTVSDFFNGLEGSSVPYSERGKTLKTLMSEINKHEGTNGKKSKAPLYIGILALAGIGAGVACYFLTQKKDGSNPPPIIPPAKLPPGLSVSLCDNATDTIKFPDGGIRWPQVVNVNATVSNMPTTENPKGTRADLLSVELNLPSGYNVTDSFLTFANGTRVKPVSVSADKIVYRTGYLNPKDNATVSTWLQSTLDSRTGDFSAIVAGNYDGKSSAAHASKTILVPLQDLYPTLKEIYRMDPNWAREIAVKNIRMEDGKLDLDELAYWRHPNASNCDKMIKKDFAALSANATYVPLVQEWKKLPEFRTDNSTVEATEDLVYLALNATNPEVREAFQLMLKGGTPDPRDFKYTVPSWNTELQVLRWLAEQNEFKRNDTLAQSIAMVNGLWVTMGDEQVRQAVYRDVNGMLNFGRDTAEIQKTLGLPYNLEDYRLLEKTLWAWLGNYSPSGGRPYPLKLFTNKKLNLDAYNWDTVSLETLKGMRELMIRNWLNSDTDKSVKAIEDHFYFNGDTPAASKHWKYVSDAIGNSTTIVDGKVVINHDLNNVDYLFNEYQKHGIVTGECGDEAILIEAFLKSGGISATFAIRQATLQPHIDSHMYPIYFNPLDIVWKANVKHLNLGINSDSQYTLYVARPPVNEKGYLEMWNTSRPPIIWTGNMYYTCENLSIKEIRDMFLNGQSNQNITQWLLYDQFKT